MVEVASHRLPIFDGHNDVIGKLQGGGKDVEDFFAGFPDGHLDYPRAVKASYAGGLFAVYVPNPDSDPDSKSRLVKNDAGYRVEIAPPLEYEYAHQTAVEMIEGLHRLERKSEGRLRIIPDYPALESCLTQDIMAIVIHLEGAEPIQPSLGNLASFYERGVRSIGLTWSRENAFGHGVPFQIPASPDTGPGLTAAGKALVKTCNEWGILVDLAHLNMRGFWDVAELSQAPLVSSHTAAHALIPRTRNLTDDQLLAIQDTGGLVGLTFAVNDLDGGVRPKKDAPLSAITRHIRYLVDLMGIDHVAFGSDFDGTTIPADVGDVTGFPTLLDELRRAGFSERDLEKICYRNWLRVLRETWKGQGSRAGS